MRTHRLVELACDAGATTSAGLTFFSFRLTSSTGFAASADSSTFWRLFGGSTAGVSASLKVLKSRPLTKERSSLLSLAYTVSVSIGRMEQCGGAHVHCGVLSFKFRLRIDVVQQPQVVFVASKCQYIIE